LSETVTLAYSVASLEDVTILPQILCGLQKRSNLLDLVLISWLIMASTPTDDVSMVGVEAMMSSLRHSAHWFPDRAHSFLRVLSVMVICGLPDLPEAPEPDASVMNRSLD
jgi:hypothetical protein